MDAYTPAAKLARRQYIDITFQEGPPATVGTNGAHIEDVLDLLLQRLRQLNTGELRCRENSLAITDLESAQHWLMRRTMNRVEQGVEGTSLPHLS